MCDSLTESSNAESLNLSSMAIGDVVALMNRQDETVVAAVQAALPAITALAEAVHRAMSQGGHLYYVGAGTSGRLGVLDAAECPPTFGTAYDEVQAIIAGGSRAMTQAVENAEDSREEGALALQQRAFGTQDFLIGISASGGAPFVRGALAYARSLGAATGSIFCNPGAPLERDADYPVLVAVGPEILRGSTRLKAGTATKMVLNMISTSVMVALGHCIGNLMVDVAANNSKLVKRQQSILAELADITPEEAQALLQECHGDMRQALAKAQGKGVK